jgi:hypothetical protein
MEPEQSIWRRWAWAAFLSAFGIWVAFAGTERAPYRWTTWLILSPLFVLWGYADLLEHKRQKSERGITTFIGINIALFIVVPVSDWTVLSFWRFAAASLCMAAFAVGRDRWKDSKKKFIIRLRGLVVLVVEVLVLWVILMKTGAMAEFLPGYQWRIPLTIILFWAFSEVILLVNEKLPKIPAYVIGFLLVFAILEVGLYLLNGKWNSDWAEILIQTAIVTIIVGTSSKPEPAPATL